MRFILGELADNPMTGSDFDWMVSNHAAWGWKAPVKASVSGVSLLHLSPFFASIFPLSPQKRLILRLWICGVQVLHFGSLSVEFGFRIPPVRGILDSLSRIPDFKAQDRDSTSKIFPEFGLSYIWAIHSRF